jgi:hypothetical protein
MHIAEDAEEARLARLREDQLTPEDARIMLAEERASERPCPDLIAYLSDIARNPR